MQGRRRRSSKREQQYHPTAHRLCAKEHWATCCLPGGGRDSQPGARAARAALAPRHPHTPGLAPPSHGTILDMHSTARGTVDSSPAPNTHSHKEQA